MKLPSPLLLAATATVIPLIAQVPSTAPGDFPAWMASFCYAIGSVVLIVHGINQVIALIQTIRGKAVDPYGQKLATLADVSDAVQPVTDALTNHAKDDSKQFGALETKIDKLTGKVETLVVVMERTQTILKLMQRRYFKHDDDDEVEEASR